jgi:anti-anti-sigma regulatory factor
MFVKIDTKAYFRVFRVTTPSLHANMAEELRSLILENMAVPPGNVILDLKEVTNIDSEVAEIFVNIHTSEAAGKTSFIITGIGTKVAEELENIPTVRQLKLASTFSEAVDLVMMEEVERELLSGGDKDTE